MGGGAEPSGSGVEDGGVPNSSRVGALVGSGALLAGRGGALVGSGINSFVSGNGGALVGAGT